MKKRFLIMLAFAVLALATVFTGCGAGSGNTQDAGGGEENPSSQVLADGLYTADFETDSSMFHINEALHGKGTLTVENGQMTIHIVLPSKNIVNLYPGLAEDAQKQGAVLLEPSDETVEYEDGAVEVVNSFDVPVPAVGQEFDLALIGTHGKWYDHKVKVENPEAL